MERNKNFSTVTANPLVWQNYRVKLQQKVTAASQYPHNLYICEISSNFPINVMAADCLNAYPDYNKPFKIYTDASDYQLGATIIGISIFGEE